ncbi:DNA glycosylase AlkZ-like family protein [Nocardioides acrostichi]|uniref:Winged helix DNA-binding domain-containing protein n=1 Tax=Nocardioides acrostichi TaxID=2784339 RepID=A0A930UZF9_9ACTN|nr:crosslink repair DNA glycosylase YcaQ family protein [Nocardioides acrostichi]MBF4160875.1 winged helix DNA-binding domain-containing protein [Nocardioides acrostichi]
MAALSVSRGAARSWRLERHLLDPVGGASVTEVVRRLTGVPTMDAAKAELAVRVRRTGSQAGELATAIADGDVVQAFAFRGAVHVMAPDDAGAWLAVRGAGRQWELKSWREHYRLEADDWPPLLDAVRAAVADGPVTFGELGAALTAHRRFAHLRATFEGDYGTLVKPFFWQGACCFGPPREGRATLRSLDHVRGWRGIWDLDEAGPHCVVAYLGAFGPASRANIHHWLGAGLSAGRQNIERWLAGLGDRLAQARLEGVDEPTYALAEHTDGLTAAEPSRAVRLLPGHDAWVMGPGSDDQLVVPPMMRPAVTRKSDLVLVDGVVRGTWRARAGEVVVAWPDDDAPAELDAEALAAEVERVAALL